MNLAPVCRICGDGKRLSLSKVWGCCGPKCQRVAHGRRFSLYHCAKHRGATPPGTPSYCVECLPIARAVRAAVDAIRAKRPGFGGGSGSNRHGTGAAWYDETIYPGDTYPVLPRAAFELLAGELVGPGWRGYDSQVAADNDAVRVLLATQSSESDKPQPES